MSIYQDNDLRNTKQIISLSEASTRECFAYSCAGIVAMIAVILLTVSLTACGDYPLSAEPLPETPPPTSLAATPDAATPDAATPDAATEAASKTTPGLMYTQIASYNEGEIPAPRISVWVNALARYYYISVPPKLASEIENALKIGKELTVAEPNPSEHSGYAVGIREIPIYYYEKDDSLALTILRSIDGELGFIGYEAYPVEATNEARMLIELATKSTGWDFSAGLEAFAGITAIAVMFGEEVFATVTERENLEAFEDFIRNSVHYIGPMKTQEQSIELRCDLAGGGSVSIVADPQNSMLWLPPGGYYAYAGYGWPDEDHILGETRILLDILGLEHWPIDTSHESYPEGFWVELYERLEPAPPQEGQPR